MFVSAHSYDIAGKLRLCVPDLPGADCRIPRFLRPIPQICTHPRIQHGSHGHRAQKSRKAEQLAHHRDRNEHPHRGQHSAFSEQLMLEEVQIERLQNRHDQDEPHGHSGLCHQNDERGGKRPEQGSHIRNEICDALRYGVKKSKAEQLLEDINSIRAEETAAPSFETQVECIETINKVKKGAPAGIAKGIDALMMSVVGGYSCKEIGKKLHMRTNIVTAKMSKARKYLCKIPELNDLYFAGDAV